jgi:hypothetical protein
VANNRHDQRRQGVVYGPVFPPQGGGRSAGVWIGRILGLFVVVLAFGVLGIGVYTFIGLRASPGFTPSPSAASPTPTLLPVAPSPEPTPTPLPTPTPSISASPSPVPSASASPAPSEPPVQIGAGFVTFGTQIDNQLRIIDPRAVFGPTERITWSAHLTASANSADLLIQILKIDPTAQNGQRLIHEDPVTPAVTDAQIFQRRIRPQDILEGPGIYHVRYMRGDSLLAEGYFEITA